MKININVLEFDETKDLNVIIVHHYFIREFARLKDWGFDEIEITLRELEKKIGLSIRQIRSAIDKLEEAKIIEVRKGGGKKPSTYRYIVG